MGVGGIITEGLAGGSSGVSRISTWGLIPAIPPPRRIVRLSAKASAGLSLTAAAKNSSPLAASSRSTVYLIASLDMSAPVGSIPLFVGENVPVIWTVDGLPATSAWTLDFLIMNSAGTVLADVGVVPDTPIVGNLTATIPRMISLSLVPGTHRFELHRRDVGFETMLSYGTVVVTPALSP
jgi:hypothetical protein